MRILGANRSGISFPFPPMKLVLDRANQLEPWNQAFSIEFLKNFKICIRIPGANRSGLSFPFPPMKPVLDRANQLEPWNQAFSIEFLKNFKICIRIPGANGSVLFLPPIEFSSTFCEQKFHWSQEYVKWKKSLSSSRMEFHFTNYLFL